MNEKSPIFNFIIVWGSIVLFWLITIIKKKKQMGKRWKGTAKIKVKDKELTCHACGNNTFSKREALLNTTWTLLFQWGFWNRSGACYVCSNCSHIHWFANAKKHNIDRIKTTD